jgi:uncharacterized protein with FMN-binding domain
MRRITWWLLSTVAALALLFSYRTSTMGAGPATAVAGGAADPGAAVAAPAPAPSASSGGGTSGGDSTSGGTTYQGSVAQTRWGAVQVTITVANGKITSVAVPPYPTANGRDRQINARALPILKQETLDAQSADIDTVSGATVTSDGYTESLQAALDAAHLS